MVFTHVCLADVLRMMHDGTGLLKLQRRGFGGPHVQRTLAEVHLVQADSDGILVGRETTSCLLRLCSCSQVHLADSRARAMGSLWETTSDFVRVPSAAAIQVLHLAFTTQPPC